MMTLDLKRLEGSKSHGLIANINKLEFISKTTGSDDDPSIFFKYHIFF